MALSNIIERIESEARQKAAKILRDASQAAEEARAASRKKAAEQAHEILEKGRLDAESHKKRLITLASLDVRKQKGDTRQAFIDQAFSRALEQIKQMPEASYRELLAGLIVEAAETGEEQILLSPRDRALATDGFLASVNAKLKERGKKPGLSLSPDTRQISGGAILVGKHVEINCSFDATLGLIRDYIESEVAQILFGDAK